MARWEPGAQERLRAAALTLFAERGYESTTAAEIAESTGLTERTFFRHFTDKREVLFHGQDLFQATFTDAVTAAPENAPVVEVVRFALRSAAEQFFPDERRPYSRLRQTIITANVALQERESLKMAWLAGAIATALRERGVREPQATLAAQSAVTVFVVAFDRWIAPTETRALADIETEIWDELRSLTTGSLTTPA